MHPTHTISNLIFLHKLILKNNIEIQTFQRVFEFPYLLPDNWQVINSQGTMGRSGGPTEASGYPLGIVELPRQLLAWLLPKTPHFCNRKKFVINTKKA